MLILASDGNPEYIKFQEFWRTYTKSHPSIDCLFYKGNPSMEKDAELVNDTVYVKIEDTLDNVYDKLMMTLRFLEPSLRNYNFMYRTNLSSFVDFHKFVHFCSLLPSSNVCAAVIGEHEGIVFPSGAGFTMSIDLVKRLLQENHPRFYLDDVTIGKAMSTWNVQYVRVNRIDYKGNSVWVYEHQSSPNEIVFHYRAKTSNRDEDYAALQEMRRRTVSPLLFVNRS